MPRALSLLNFFAGLLFGIAVVAALFAAMEPDDGLWSQRLLLAALAALVAGAVVKLAARPRRWRSREMRSAARRREATGADTGWAATAPGDAVSLRSGAVSSGRRAASAVPDLPAVHTDSRGPATADGDGRRL